MSSKSENNSPDVLEAPAWMNDEFFTKVLVEHLKDPNLKVISIKTSPATVKGDNYVSVMFRSLVEYSSKKGTFSKSLIIKTIPEADNYQKEIGDGHVFPTEISMYTEILPKFEAILSEAGEETTLCAKCIYHSLEPRKVIILEDLVLQGYELIRGRDATVQELKVTLEKLAKWHAVSFKLLKEDPKVFEHLKYDLTRIPNFLTQDFMISGLPNFIDMLGSSDSLKKYQKYFEPLRENLIKRWTNIIREYRDNRREDSYYVVCHGDYHMKNMMFKGNDCMLVDFQLSYVGSITNDIIYAIYMLLNPEDRRERYDELIYHYFKAFSRTLSTIGYKGKAPTLLEFRRQLFDRRVHGKLNYPLYQKTF